MTEKQWDFGEIYERWIYGSIYAALFLKLPDTSLVLSKPALGFSLGCHHESTLSCRNSIPQVPKL